MINMEQAITTVDFAKTDDNAVVGVTAYGSTLLLQELAKDKKVSDPLEDGDTNVLPKVVCNFSTVKSVEVMIKALETIKFNLTYPYGTLPLAC